MGVVFFVTGITICRGVLKSRREMAFLAVHLGMFSHQRKPRLVVVERRFLPRPVIVAVLALCALLSIMFVVLLMAGVTVHRGILVTVLRMACFAGHVGMLSPKRILGLVVIESNGFPGILRMALCAEFSDPAFVCIVLLVAAVAG
jgi:hypothetical protein